MLKRTAYHSLHFSGALFAILLLSSCADIEQEKKQEEIRAAQKKRDEQALKLQKQKRTEQELAEQKKREEQELAEKKKREEQELAEKKKREEQELAEKKRREEQYLAEKKKLEKLFLIQGPPWDMFEQSCRNFYCYQFTVDKDVIAKMLYAKIYRKGGTVFDDYMTDFQRRLPAIASSIESALAEEKIRNHDVSDMQSSNQAETVYNLRMLAFKKRMYRAILRYGIHVSLDDICEIAVNSDPASHECIFYSETSAKALLQAYAIPEKQAVFNVIDRFWFVRLHAACTLGDIAKAEEILNEYSEKCKPADYICLIRDACGSDKPEMVKFLLPAVSNTEFSSGLNKEGAEMFGSAIYNSDGRCLPLLLEKFPLDKKTLIMLISCAVEGSSNANIFCLTKKFEESRNHADKDDYSVDCSMPLIKGNTEILKELKRVGIQISLDSLPAIIADNGPTVLSSIDAVMEGKTPLLLASKSDKMDKAMLAAAAVGNVEVLKKLVQYGGEVNCMDENEKSPLAIAKEKNHRECIVYLESVNAVSAKFQLRATRSRRIEDLRRLRIKLYKDDLSRRQKLMLKGLVILGENIIDKMLLETLLQAKIYDDSFLAEASKDFTGNYDQSKYNKLKSRWYYTFARAKVFKTTNPNCFEILVYPELSPVSEELRNEIEWRISDDKGSIDDHRIHNLFEKSQNANVERFEKGIYITVMKDGDMIRILNSQPGFSVSF